MCTIDTHFIELVWVLNSSGQDPNLQVYGRVERQIFSTVEISKEMHRLFFQENIRRDLKLIDEVITEVGRHFLRLLTTF